MRGDVLSAEGLEARRGHLLRQAISVDRHGEVPRIALFEELNPNPPEVILCSASVKDGALVLVKSKTPCRYGFERTQADGSTAKLGGP